MFHYNGSCAVCQYIKKIFMIFSQNFNKIPAQIQQADAARCSVRLL